MEGKSKKREPGEYTFPKKSEFKEVYFPERNYFLNVVSDIVPEVHEDILNNIASELNKVYEEQKEDEFKAINWSNIKKDEFFIDLKKAIINLKNKYNLIEADNCKKDWISILVLEEADRLLKTGQYKENKDNKKIKKNEVEYTPFQITIEHEDLSAYFLQKNNKEKFRIDIGDESLFWNPILKSRAAKKREINYKKLKDNEQDKIDKDMDRICDYMEELGCKKLGPKKDMYKRLVLYQVKEMTFPDIIDNFFEENPYTDKNDEKTIQKSVERLAERIGIKRRTQI
ncbi:hypothetical protein C8C76_13017 [Halanaerobium saccharolyticum]|jgi:hypothetical protein|uniref:Uncharacterized protein n=1 Tax=Halanaerobium saccharolyticum TaxID=43595 RepID=A0A2T5RH47_9FIRM|nr:hypothetical protein [Halanaerobium saccharolyticum]PTV95027.1 hypothetical protein C8C76_13017 [Halanaerobium saccharolyticum]